MEALKLKNIFLQKLYITDNAPAFFSRAGLRFERRFRETRPLSGKWKGIPYMNCKSLPFQKSGHPRRAYPYRSASALTRFPYSAAVGSHMFLHGESFYLIGKKRQETCLFYTIMFYPIGSKSAAPCLQRGQTISSGSSSPSYT